MQVCLINHVTIAAKESEVGGITMDQLCSNCSGGGCRCIMDASVPEAIAKVGGSFSQYCGEGSSCYIGDREVPCKDLLSKQNKTSLLYYLAILVFVVFVVIWILYRGAALMDSYHLHDARYKQLSLYSLEEQEEQEEQPETYNIYDVLNSYQK
jgi:hypothetical protein